MRLSCSYASWPRGPPYRRARERSEYSQEPNFWLLFADTACNLLQVFTEYGLWDLVEESCIALVNAARANQRMQAHLLSR